MVDDSTARGRGFRVERFLASVLGADAFVFAALTGVAVVAVTMLADRLGGRVGGLLATAPVTTSAAHVVIATSVPAGEASARVLSGVAALLAGTLAIVVFFYAVKFTRGRPDGVRLAAGLAAHVAVYLPLSVLLAQAAPPPLVAFPVLFALHGVLGMTFARVPVPVLRDYVPRKAGRSVPELGVRFLAGAGVVLAVRALVDAFPALAGALAVVPAVFLVSLTVMGVTQNAPFAARAAQAGLFGTTAVAVFVLVVGAVLAFGVPGGVWMALPFGWAAYAGTLALLGAAQRRLAR